MIIIRPPDGHRMSLHELRARTMQTVMPCAWKYRHATNSFNLTSWFVCRSWGCWHASAYCSSSLSISSLLLYCTSLPSELNMISATLQSHNTLSFIASLKRFRFLLLNVTCVENVACSQLRLFAKLFDMTYLYIRSEVRHPRAASVQDHVK